MVHLIIQMMITSIQLGTMVRRQHDDGWGAPGCVLSYSGDKLRIYWPDENVFTREFPADLVPYDIVSQPEVAA